MDGILLSRSSEKRLEQSARVTSQARTSQVLTG